MLTIQIVSRTAFREARAKIPPPPYGFTSISIETTGECLVLPMPEALPVQIAGGLASPWLYGIGCSDADALPRPIDLLAFR